jgi:hypothetical protein
MPQHEAMVLKVVNCARCGLIHDAVKFVPFGANSPPNYTHWATCPVSRCPILMRVEPDDDPASLDDIQLARDIQDPDMPPLTTGDLRWWETHTFGKWFGWAAGAVVVAVFVGCLALVLWSKWR